MPYNSFKKATCRFRLKCVLKFELHHAIQSAYLACITYVAYMYILPILLLCPAAGAREMLWLLIRRQVAAAAGRAGRRPGGAGRYACPGGAPASPYQGESA